MNRIYSACAALAPGVAAVVFACALNSCRSAAKRAGKRGADNMDRVRAAGPTRGLNPVLRRAFDGSRHFQRMDRPGPGDWLDRHHEPGQTYEQYEAARFNKPDRVRASLVLQPLGRFEPGASPRLKQLEEFAAAYFGLRAEVRPVIDPAAVSLTSRVNPHTRNRQILATDVLEYLKKRLPADAYCYLGVTMIDLYPDPTWNFVFGMASLRERVGVFSFVRYDPAFYGEARGKGYRSLLARRSLKVLAHETGHMFGMQHCIFWNCVMNGSNHLQESDRRPIHLCPVCLRKLYHAVGFDVVKRYLALKRVYRSGGLEEEARWVGRRLRWIEGR